MAKPTTLPIFDTNGTNVSTPASGLQTDGYANGAKPTAANINFLFRWIYQWLLWLDGLLTSGGGFTALAGQHITVSSTGEFKHGDLILNLSPAAWRSSTGAFVDAQDYFESTGSGNAQVSLPLKLGDRVKSVVYQRYGDGAVDITNTDVVIYTNPGSPSEISDNPTVTNPAAAWNSTTATCTPTALTLGQSLQLRVSYNAAALRLGNIYVVYDRP